MHTYCMKCACLLLNLRKQIEFTIFFNIFVPIIANITTNFNNYEVFIPFIS